MKDLGLFQDQYYINGIIADEMGYSVCTCGDCGCTILINIKDEETTCYGCGFVGEACDFPDLFYM